MTSLHHRSASIADRRSAHLSSGPPRVSSTRSRDYDRPPDRDRDGVSPAVPDPPTEPRDSAHRHSKSDNRLSGVERRKERTTITTTDTVYTRRSPKKDLPHVDLRKSDAERRRSAGPSVLKRPVKENPQGRHPRLDFQWVLISM